MNEGWLIDKSALVRLPTHQDEPMWSSRIDRGLVHICAVTLLEVGYSTRNAAGHATILGAPPLSRMVAHWDMPAETSRRAYEVQGLLAARGQHRAPSIPDLLIAAVAEAAKLTILHCDKDFDLIAELTGQPSHYLD